MMLLLITIRSSFNSPYFTYQFASPPGKLLTYEIYAYSKKVNIIRNNVQCVKNKIVNVSWTNSGNLLICDEFQNVYIVSGDGKKFQKILPGSSIAINNPVLILPYYSGFLMVNNNSKLSVRIFKSRVFISATVKFFSSVLQQNIFGK